MQNLNYKIAFVYEYGDESWSTPQSLINEFTRRGHSVSKYHLTKYEKFSQELAEKSFDILITLDWKGIDFPQDVHDIIPSTCFKIRECADTPQNYEKHLPYIKNYNLLLTPDFGSSEKYTASGTRCIWFNHFADTNIHRVYPLVDSMPPVRSTRGQGGSNIMDYLSTLMPSKFINRNGLIGPEYGQFLSNGKIVIQHSRWGEITRRVFEGMACNSLVLTDRLMEHTKISELFEEGEEIVYYDDIPSLISKINYYLCPEGEGERLFIANNGFNKVTKYHTQVNRVNEIISNYSIWKGSSQ